MPLGGAGSEMQKSVKNNRNLVHRRKSLQELYKENSSGKRETTKYTFKEPSPEELASIRAKAKRNKLVNMLFRAFLLLGSFMLGAYFIKLLFT